MNRPRCRCAMEPDRRVGVIGINMLWRSFEDVARHRRPFPRFALLIEETDDSSAAARECHVARKMDSHLLQPTRTLGEARCVFFV